MASFLKNSVYFKTIKKNFSMYIKWDLIQIRPFEETLNLHVYVGHLISVPMHEEQVEADTGGGPELVPEAGVCLSFSDQEMNPERKKKTHPSSHSQRRARWGLKWNAIRIDG